MNQEAEPITEPSEESELPLTAQQVDVLAAQQQMLPLLEEHESELYDFEQSPLMEVESDHFDFVENVSYEGEIEDPYGDMEEAMRYQIESTVLSPDVERDYNTDQRTRTPSPVESKAYMDRGQDIDDEVLLTKQSQSLDSTVVLPNDDINVTLESDAQILISVVCLVKIKIALFYYDILYLFIYLGNVHTVT